MTLCQAPLADLINAVSLANKISHAHMHAYELHLSASDIDPHATVSWPKVRAKVNGLGCFATQRFAIERLQVEPNAKMTARKFL
jgi:hypothetical protein